MKKAVLKTGVLLAAAAAALLVTGHMLGAATQQEAAQYTQLADDDAGGYTVKAYNGKVALFTDEFYTSPAIETDIIVESLRSYDRNLLEDGITVGTYEDVLRIFEDLGCR